MVSWMGLLEASAAGGICIVLFYLVSQFWGEHYRAKYRKILWILIALRMCIPVSSQLFPRLAIVEIPILVLRENGGGQIAEYGGGASSEQTYLLTEGMYGAEKQPIGDMTGKDKAIGQAVGKGMKNQSPADGQAGARPFTLSDMLLLLWACGCVSIMGYYLSVHCAFCANMRRNSRKCRDKGILAAAAKEAWKLGLKTVPQIRLLEGVQTGPFTVGFFRNTVYLPAEGCRGRELQYIIRHELAHCAEKDTGVKLFFIFVNAIHWFNPLVWFMKSLVDQDMELICDERVLEDTTKEERKEYGELLLACIGTDRAGRSVLSTGYVQGLKFLKKRFRNIFNVQKKNGRVAMCILGVLLMVVSGMVGFEAGRTVYAGGQREIAVDRGIELRTDVTGDGAVDRVQVYDDTYRLTTSVLLRATDGKEAQFTYDEDLWASSYLVSGDLSGNGAADIVVMRVSNGMHGEGMVSVLHVVEEGGVYVWQEYPETFLRNPSIDSRQPESFSDIVCTGAEIVEGEERCYLRLTALDLEVFDDSTVQYITCSLQEGGWYIEDIQTVTEDDSSNPVEGAFSERSSVDENPEPVEGQPGEEDVVPKEDEPDSSVQQTESDSHSDDMAELEEMVTAFYRAYFDGDADSIRHYLADSFEDEIEVYDKTSEGITISAIKGLQDAAGKAVGEACEASVEFLEAGEDSYTYLTIELVRAENGWEIVFYGLEK